MKAIGQERRKRRGKKKKGTEQGRSHDLNYGKGGYSCFREEGAVQEWVLTKLGNTGRGSG